MDQGQARVVAKKRVFLTSRNSSRCSMDMERRTPKSMGMILRIALEAIATILAVVTVSCALSIPDLRRKTVWIIPIWKWAMASLLTVTSRHISFAVVTAFGLLLRRFFKSKPGVVYVVSGLNDDARSWMTRVFFITPLLVVISEKSTKEENQVLLKLMEVIIAVLTIFSVWFTKCIITMCCAAWFHLKNYQVWIEESLFYWYVVEVFSGNSWSWVEIHHVFDPKRTSAWDMKKMLTDQTKYGLGVKIRSEADAESAAKLIFGCVAKQGSEFIEMDDLSRFLPRRDALRFMNLFGEMEEDESIRISASLFEEWIEHAFLHERQLVTTLKNMDALSNKINGVVNLVVGIVLSLVVFLPLVGVVDRKLLSFLTTNAFIATFFLGNMWKSMFDSIVLIFVEHPFEVGDKCEVEEVEMIVEDIQITSTWFVGMDKKKYRYTNLDLWSKGIVNHNRSQCTTWGEMHLEKEKEKEREKKAKVLVDS